MYSNSLFNKVRKNGEKGFSEEKYLDLPDGINISDTITCAQVSAFEYEHENGTEFLVYVLHNFEDEIECWGEFVRLDELPIECIKKIIEFIEEL